MEYEAQFVGSGNPRQCTIFGTSPASTRLTFETTEGMETTTKIRTGDGAEVASLHWILGSAPGNAFVGGQQVHMADFAVMQGYSPGSRGFNSSDTDGTRTQFVWQRTGTRSYDLYAPHGVRIGQYVGGVQINRPFGGPAYASFRFVFDHDVLFLDAMIALCVNIWIDGMILSN